MKVLMLTPSYSPIVGGTEVVVKELTTNLIRNGVETDVMTFNMDRKWEPNWKSVLVREKEFKVYRIPAYNPLKETFNSARDFFKLHVFPNPCFRKILEDYDLLHFHDDVDLTFPIFSSFIRKPRVFHLHTLQETAHTYERNPVSKYSLLKSSNLFLVGSSDTAKLAKELGALKIRILPYGVDIEKFTFNPKNVYSENREKNLVLFVGRLEKRKGIDILLSSLDAVKTRVNLILILGPNNNDDYSREILSLIESENKKGRHKITHLGPLNHEDLVKWYKKASIFVCPSTSETFGVVNIEAMACGTPVVASDIQGIRTIIENGKDGLLIPPNNSFKLAEAIQYLLDNESVRIKLGEEGRKKVEREFSWKVIAEKLCRIYEEMLA